MVLSSAQMSNNCGLGVVSSCHQHKCPKKKASFVSQWKISCIMHGLSSTWVNSRYLDRTWVNSRGNILVSSGRSEKICMGEEQFSWTTNQITFLTFQFPYLVWKIVDPNGNNMQRLTNQFKPTQWWKKSPNMTSNKKVQP